MHKENHAAFSVDKLSKLSGESDRDCWLLVIHYDGSIDSLLSTYKFSNYLQMNATVHQNNGMPKN